MSATTMTAVSKNRLCGKLYAAVAHHVVNMVGVTHPVVAFVGVGVMAEGVMARLLQDLAWPPERVVAAHRREERRAELAQRHGVPVESENASAVARADVVVLAVRPQDMDELLATIRSSVRPGQVVLSLAAALSLDWLAHRLPSGTAILRAVPPPTTWIRAGLGYLSGNAFVSPAQWDVAEKIIGATCERVLRLPDELIDPVTGIGAATTPYSCFLIEALIDAGVEMGVPEDLARTTVIEGWAAAGRLLRESSFSPRAIITMVATRGGLTEASLAELKAGRADRAMRAAARAMVWRSIELRGESLPDDMAPGTRLAQ